MLETEELSIEAAAGQVGYEDASFFGRLFRRKVGLSALVFAISMLAADRVWRRNSLRRAARKYPALMQRRRWWPLPGRAYPKAISIRAT